MRGKARARPARRTVRFLTAVLLSGLLLSLPGCGRSYRFDRQARDGGYVMGAASPSNRQETAYFRIQINSHPQAAGGEKQPFFIGNPAENTKNVQVSVTLDASGELIYRSPVLHPGEREPYGVLLAELSPGDYAATACFTLLDPQTGQETGSMAVALTVTVTGQ